MIFYKQSSSIIIVSTSSNSAAAFGVLSFGFNLLEAVSSTVFNWVKGVSSVLKVLVVILLLPEGTKSLLLAETSRGF